MKYLNENMNDFFSEMGLFIVWACVNKAFEKKTA